MGSSRWSDSDWKAYSHTTSKKSYDEVFTSKSMKDDFDPSKLDMRESRDSDVNPESTAIIIGSDVTGSMGIIADNLIRKGIGVVFEELLTRKPVSDPHLMVLGVGDVTYDTAPLQATQFEADLKIAEQLENIYIEHGGGGNNWESYNLPWYFAAEKTSIDCFEKRGKKGYLFTVGDEEIPEDLTKHQIKKVLGLELQTDSISNQDLLTMVGRKYEVFHVIIEEGSHARSHLDRVRSRWTELLGQRAISLSDHTKLAEVIVSAIEINEGRDANEVIGSWDGDTSLAVGGAVAALAKGASAADGVTRL